MSTTYLLLVLPCLYHTDFSLVSLSRTVMIFVWSTKSPDTTVPLVQVIQDGIKGKQPTIKLLGRIIDVDFNAGIFVTLNP
jgi:hypothetical protein